jgi:hypothetical protein
MNMKFDPERLRLPSSAESGAIQSVTRPPRHKPGEKFLKGPIPLTWLAIAGEQPGKALHVGVALWHLAGLKRTQTVPLSASLLLTMGVSRHSGYRGLKALEGAGLVSIVRHPGRLPIVTILEVLVK